MKIVITDDIYEDKSLVAREIMQHLNEDFDVTVYEHGKEVCRMPNAMAKGYINVYVK